jgi:two-component system CheB/CheR fusion protein
MGRRKTSAGPRRRGAIAAEVCKPRAGRPDARCPVVGIGASAGGLATFESFFRATPPDSGAAFVLIQHLDPTHESLTAELLTKHTRMPVVQVEGDTPVEPDHVYVIPPNKYLSIERGTLRLTAPSEPRGMRMPIDLFLRSLAADRPEKAVGIILSGTGTDGSLGLKEIEGAGGMTMVQAPETAQYDGMPRSAIATGGVDHVLAVEDMPGVLLQWVRQAYVTRPAAATPVPEEPADDLGGILAMLRTRSRFDFSCYKKAPLRRRIQRRMSLRHVAGMAEYLRLLRSNADEVKALSTDLLISVTSFFRDRPAWQLLEEEIIPRIVDGKKAGQPVRVWVPGCATGEEAYSVAILLIERLEAAERPCPLQIFASDIDGDALDVARAGVYPESIAADVTPARLRRFFVKEEHTYRVDKELRESVIFAQQNLLSDPPFSRLDLVSCRNLLMYLEAAVQEKIVALLHFSLLDGGYLFLGSAETIFEQEDLFEPVSKKWRVYRRIGPTRQEKVEFPVASEPKAGMLPARAVAARPALNRVAALAQQLLVERYAPACVVISRKGEILYFSGSTEDYLMQPPGLPTPDIFAQAREGLQLKLRAAVQRAIRENQPVGVTGTAVRRGTTRQQVKFSVEPIKVSSETEGLLLVSFEDEPAAPRQAPPPLSELAVADEPLAHQLESELKTTREELRSTIEQLETANEELQASNEEVMSANEELQSTNEELQTSKEELQSLNEELSTINAQLQSKVDELERTNNDLDNLLASTNLATVFLDQGFRIRRFTPAATGLFTLIPSDVGRPLSDIAQKFTDPDLLADGEAVIEKLAPMRKEVRTHDGRWYMREALPYRTRDNRIEGVVITFSDAAEEVLQEARLQAEAIVDAVYESLLVLDASLRVVSANRVFYETFQTSAEETENRSLLELGSGAWDVPELRAALAEVLPEGKPVADFEVHRRFERLGERTMLVRARPLARGGGRPAHILLAIEDITERKRNEEALRESAGKIRAIVDSTVDGMITIDEGGIVIAFNPAAERTFGYPSAEVIGRNVSILMPAPYHDEHDGYIAGYLKTGVPRIIGKSREVIGRRKDGTTFPMELAVGEYHDGKGLNFVGIVRDISARKRAEEELRRHEAELVRVLRVTLVGELAGGLAHELSQPLVAIANTLEVCTRRLRAGEKEPRRLLSLVKQATDQSVQAGRIVRNVRDLILKRQPKRDRTDLRLLVQNCAALVAGQIAEHRIAFHLAPGEKPLPVRVSSIEIEQVILNLLQNAIDSIRQAGGKRRDLIVQASRRNDTGEVTVRDTGTGISSSVARQMFEPFFTTKDEGLGMGLAICRSIVEAHDGRLSVTPRQRGGGATVRFTLPLSRASGRAPRGGERRAR